MVDSVQRDVFISHEKGDGDVALELAARLRAQGFTTWCYEEDSAAGTSYLVQIDRAIEEARSIIVIVSHRSLRSPHVRNEVVRAYECQKRFIPVRRDIEHEELLRAHGADDEERRREWRMAFGASVSIAWDAREPQRVVERISAGLLRLGVEPGAVSTPFTPPLVARLHRSGPTVRQRAAAFAREWELEKHQQVFTRVLRAPWTRVAVGALVALAGIWFNAGSLLAMLGDDPDQQYLRRAVPRAFYSNFAANAVGLWLNFLILRALWNIVKGDWNSEPGVSRYVNRQLQVVFLWVLISTLIAFFDMPNPNARGEFVAAVLTYGLLAIAQLFMVRALFRIPDRRYPAQMPS